VVVLKFDHSTSIIWFHSILPNLCLVKFRFCRYTIYIKHGIYDESVIIDKKKPNVTMVGDGSQKTIVTGNKSHAKKIRTFLTATFGISCFPKSACARC